jgi:hypothetical protein
MSEPGGTLMSYTGRAMAASTTGHGGGQWAGCTWSRDAVFPKAYAQDDASYARYSLPA